MKSKFFAGNRQRLVDVIGSDQLVVLAGWTSMQWHGDTAVPFRQEANFWYLTGIEQPDWRLVLDGSQGKSWLIAPEIDKVSRLFDGGLDFASAKEVSGVDEVLDESAGDQLLKSLTNKHSVVHSLAAPGYAETANFVLNPATEVLQNELKQLFSSVKDCQRELSSLRAIKQPAEIKIMQQAADLTTEALEVVRKKLPGYQYEYEVEAELVYHFRRHNATHAFEPIVASGKNACTLHYIDNSSKLQTRRLLLMDVGARTDGYSADVTRTFSVGETTKRQRAVHNAVQDAQKQIIQLLKPGRPLSRYIESVNDIMKDALLSLGLMKNNKDEKNYRRYLPHSVSHGLGIDVHESLGGYKELQPGMVLTVEPGVYIPEEAIGVRIEDSVLITENGHQNLTASLSTDI